jgi:hypothetical protein
MVAVVEEGSADPDPKNRTFGGALSFKKRISFFQTCPGVGL